MFKVFISYRRQDSAYVAQTIYSELVQCLGPEAVFFDVFSIDYGQDFRAAIADSVKQADVLLAVIGNTWFDEMERRQSESNDYVRIEIESALNYSIPILPVLVDHQSFTETMIKQLPTTIQHLPYLNAISVRPGLDLINDLQHLTNTLSSEFGMQLLGDGDVDASKRKRVSNRGLSTEQLHLLKVLHEYSDSFHTVRDQHKDALQAVITQPVDSLLAYGLKRLAQWYNSSNQLDQRFVELIVMIDQGQECEAGRFQKQNERYSHLMDLLEQRPEFALVLLGRPGCGKTTLLKNLAFRLCHESLIATEKYSADEHLKAVPFYVELNHYPPIGQGNMSPRQWLEQEWRQQSFEPQAKLDEFLKQQKVVLLLDALNEMRCQGIHDFQQKIHLWRKTLQELRAQYPHLRVIFSCRSLDYSASLSDHEILPVPQVEFAELSDDKIQEYISSYLDDDAGQALYEHLKSVPGFSLEKTPFYLNLAIQQYQALGRVAEGPSALMAGMIWLALKREVKKQTDFNLPSGGSLIDPRDVRRIEGLKAWKKEPHHLPQRGKLMSYLMQLAWFMQEHVEDQGQGSKQISLALNQVETLFAEQGLTIEDVEHSLLLAARLDLLDCDFEEERCKFQHQLLQEYFAAQYLTQVCSKKTSEYQQRFVRFWKKQEVEPSVAQVIEGFGELPPLGIGDPLPPPPASGWEQTLQHAAAMHQNPSQFIEELMAQDLLQAGLCAYQPEVKSRLNDKVLQRLKMQLLELCQNASADLRVRIQAGLHLGYLGDHRFPRQANKKGEQYIEPPMVVIPAGEYTIGNDQAEEHDERPAHKIALKAFELGQHLVTNAEWACFMEAGGYEEESWWTTCDKAHLWWKGELEETKQIEWWLNGYHTLKNADDFDEAIRDHYPNWTDYDKFLWRDYIEKPESEFEAEIRQLHRPQQYRQPLEWDNSRFNNPSQPVVGICWYEALAYCQWLSDVSGKTYHLPTEAQWRAVAHGFNGREYLWSNQQGRQLANAFEAHLRRTTPVGLYQEGGTSCECGEKSLYDLGGNAWEWSLSLYQTYPLNLDSDSDHINKDGRRIITGGSWGNVLSAARCGYRNYYHPLNRINFIGFRVLREPPS